MAPKGATASFQAMFDAERARRRAEIELARSDRKAVVDAARAEVDRAAKEREDERDLRLAQIAEVLSTHEGAEVVDLLVDILGSPSEEGRFAAGRALQELAFDRFKDVALGVERAAKRLPSGSPALSELPFAIATVPEPGVLKLFALLLAHADPEVVASTIEAAIDRGDPGIERELQKLVNDTRKVSMDDETGEVDTVTLGQLAREALAELSGEDDDEP